MLRNYFVTAIRNLIKYKGFSFINIVGLAIGMAAFLLIFRYVTFEKSYDKFHQGYDSIYRIRYERTASDGSAVRFASCCPPAAPRIREKYPEIDNIARVYKYKASVSYQDLKFMEERIFFAEPDFFDILKFNFIEGDPLEGVKEPNKAFLSQSTAKKYFGAEDPIGKIFSIDKKTDYEVTGIFEDIQDNSHIKFDIVLSFENLEMLVGDDVMNAWGHSGFFTYLRLKSGMDPKAFESKLAELVEEDFGEVLRYYNLTCQLLLQPLTDIHLNSHYMQEYEINGDADIVKFLSIVAFFIIIMAWVNYINLSTARSLNRAKEVGLRKVVGAGPRQLTMQFFFETMLINFLAMLLGLGLLEISLPVFNNITGTPADYSVWGLGWFWIALGTMFIAGILLSGFYPVTVLTSYKPTSVLSGKLGSFTKGITLRRILVVFQFMIALILITGTFAVYNQLSFMRNQSLGFNMDQMMVVKAPRVKDDTYGEKLETFKKEAVNNPAVEKLCLATEVPGRPIFWDHGGIFRVSEGVEKSKNYRIIGADYDFIDVFGLEMAAGRYFSQEFPSDDSSIVLNETAVKWMEFETSESAIGEKVNYWGNIYTIIGVIKNYYQQTLKEDFNPVLYRFLPQGYGRYGQYAIKIHPQNTKATVEFVKMLYDDLFPGNPFNYFFLDEYYDQQYKGDELFGRVFSIFSFLSIFITSLGILGLSSFMSLQRTKEIGIRKVLGASIYQILVLLNKGFLILILISFVIALPLAFFGINRWLESFANKMSIDGGLFIFPLIIVLVITLITVAFNVIRAANADPVKSLRYE